MLAKNLYRKQRTLLVNTQHLQDLTEVVQRDCTCHGSTDAMNNCNETPSPMVITTTSVLEDAHQNTSGSAENMLPTTMVSIEETSGLLVTSTLEAFEEAYENVSGSATNTLSTSTLSVGETPSPMATTTTDMSNCNAIMMDPFSNEGGSAMTIDIKIVHVDFSGIGPGKLRVFLSSLGLVLLSFCFQVYVQMCED